MKKKYTFSLYENNEKDKIIINILEAIPPQMRGKLIRNILLKAAEGEYKSSIEKAKPERGSVVIEEKSQKNTENTENATKTDKKINYVKTNNNPFEGLKF